VGGTLFSSTVNSTNLIGGSGTLTGTLRAQRYNLPPLTAGVPFFGMADTTHFGLCLADNSGAVLGCTIETDLTNAPDSTTTTIPGPTTIDGTLTAKHLTVNFNALFSSGLTVNGQQLISNVPIADNNLGP